MPALQEEAAFLARYEKLNAQQREAVDTIYGPVMVIAGPGTGKTEVLSMRIANLLRSEAQVQPHEILCLTYTDEAANSMRRRLVQIIGPAAHKIAINTFHAFCNSVIQSNPDYFSDRPLQPISDLERAEVMHDILDGLTPGHPLRRLGGNVYFDVPRLAALFEVMKKENLRPEVVSGAIDAYIADLPTREKYIYKRNGKGFQKGDVKQAELDEELRKMETTRAASLLFKDYEARMKELGRYDYSDMILWVLDALRREPSLLQSYQERYQFMLVDEFQDTNGAQSDLLMTLTQFWEDPNIFVVGDDDQSIYEFQGARIRNIIDFYQRHTGSVKVIVLPQNYRSSQAILDSATATIANNTQRLIYQLTSLNLNKDIVASNDRFKDGRDTLKPVVSIYPNVLSEEADIVMQIEALRAQGVPLHEVAIIYAQHKQAENIMQLFERKGIPYWVKKPVNVLRQPVVEQLMLVLRYLIAEKEKPFSGEGYLFEILHAPYYGIHPTDLAQLSLFVQQLPRADGLRNWRMLLANGMRLQMLDLRSDAAIIRMGHNLDSWLQSLSTHPLPLLVERIVYESGIVAWLLNGTDYIWDMQVLHTFFDFVRAQCAEKPHLKLPEFIRTVDKMDAENISLPTQKVIQNDNGVRCYTAHSAKGNEFEHVFLIGCCKKYWEGKAGNNREFKLPDTITSTEDDNEKSYKTEVARRLFYVALTRAKKHLHVSYALQDNEGKELANSCFVDEISRPEERRKVSVNADGLVEHLQWAMEPVDAVKIEVANIAWVERCLQQLCMSYTTLSKYLRCPVAFYYESILKVPCLKGDALAFGSAVHHALEKFFKEMKATGEWPSKDDLLRFFDQGLWREQESMTTIQYERSRERGQSILSAYYDRNILHWTKTVEVEWKVNRFMLDGVPVTGKIDRLDFDGDTCTLIDYKTGKSNPQKIREQTSQPNDKNPAGGDYWRQMVFYKLLIDNQPDKRWHVRIGAFDYVEPDRETGEFSPLVYVPVYEADEQIVRQQLRQSYGRIMNHEFTEGCGKQDCHWCNFARRYAVVRTPAEAFVEIDDV